MAAQIESDSKLQFYPTAKYETLRGMAVLGGLYVESRNSQELKEDIGIERYGEILQGSKNFSIGILEELLKNKRYDLIERHMETHQYDDLVVADLFAGEGEWLRDYKKLNTSRGIITLIGNELETNRYNTMTRDNLVDYHYNLAFEDLQLPKRIINILLFNPPYGITNGERNVRRYLRMILERELITEDGYIIVAAKTNDIVLCSDLFVQYFEVEKTVMYKAHDEEFKKFGQQMLFLKVRKEPLDLNNLVQLTKYKGLRERFVNQAEAEIEFQDFYYNQFRWLDIKKVNIGKAFYNFIYVNNNGLKLSNKKSKAWRWIIDETKVKDLSKEIIEIPKPLKGGELANVIASGKINGEISLENGKAKHIAVGGVKELMEQRKFMEQNKKGEEEAKQETIVKSEPYLNILINNNGKYEIKELKVGGNSNDTISEE